VRGGESERCKGKGSQRGEREGGKGGCLRHLVDLCTFMLELRRDF